MIRQLLGGILLTALVGLLGWINLREHTPAPHATTARIDQRFTEFHATDFSPAGQPTWQMRGTRLDHLRPDRGYRMQAPRFRYVDPKHPGPAWTLRAPTGRANNDLTRIDLNGGVVGHRPAFGTQGQLDLRTAKLHILPRTHQAATQADARFAETRDGRTVWTSHSRGFSLDYNRRKLQQSRVSDTYDQPKTP